MSFLGRAGLIKGLVKALRRPATGVTYRIGALVFVVGLVQLGEFLQSLLQLLLPIAVEFLTQSVRVLVWGV